MESWGRGAGGREGRREAAAGTSDLARSGGARAARGGAGRSPGREGAGRSEWWWGGDGGRGEEEKELECGRGQRPEGRGPRLEA